MSANHNCWRYPKDGACVNPSYCNALGQCGYIKPKDILGKKEEEKKDAQSN